MKFFRILLLCLLPQFLLAQEHDNPVKRRHVELELDSIKTGEKWWKNSLLTGPALNVDSGVYHFVATPIWDLTGGMAAGERTMVNTRGAMIQGDFFDKVTFASAIFENQVIVPDFVRNYVNPRYVYPGGARIKDYKSGLGYDFFYATSFVNYKPSKHFNVEIGNGKHFIGEGYRSLLLSDNAFNYPYLKMQSKFWRINYTNLYAELMDIYDSGNVDQLFTKKYFATHLLDYKVSDWLNIGIFETVVWGRDSVSSRSVELQYLNPIIFFRPVEFSLGSPDNVMMGLNINSHFENGLSIYGQVALDEFLLSEIKARNGWWANKYGGQLGFKWKDFLKVKNLNILGELNVVRPFTYTHFNRINNYGHFNQSLAHPLGANFSELVGQVNYKYKKFYADAKLSYASYGADSTNSTFTYGGDLFRSYNDRAMIYGNTIGQGLNTKYLFGELKLGYEFNPVTKMRAEVSFYRRTTLISEQTESINWLSISFKTLIGNRYLDFL